MKKSISLAALIAVSSLFIVGCSKDDTEAPIISFPIISLIGSNPFQLEMLQTYSEPGATAEDNEDGDISSSINVDDSDIDNRLPDTYEVYYSVSDAAGNPADAIREVVVFATNNALAKTYSVIDCCFTTSGVFVPPVYTYTQVLTSTGAATNVWNNFGGIAVSPAINTSINGSGAITMSTQNINSATTVSGTGVVVTTGFRLDYTLNTTGGSTSDCRAYYTRN
jgi:Domain of unknown function (DUF5011)